jgi:hypothetical protein
LNRTETLYFSFINETNGIRGTKTFVPHVSRAKPTSAICRSDTIRVVPKEWRESSNFRHTRVFFFHLQSVFDCVLSNWQLIIEKNNFFRQVVFFPLIQPNFWSSFTSHNISYFRSFITTNKIHFRSYNKNNVRHYYNDVRH